MPVITPDWSYFQNYLDKTFNRRIGIFRCSFSPDFADPRFLGNANLAKVLYDEGKVDGFICYQVLLKSYTVKQQYDAFWKQIGPNVPDWLLGVMEDLEVWGGKSYEQHGDMSAMYNQIAGMHAKEFGSLRAVPWYGNSSDLNELIPHRDKRTWGILAAYTGKLQFKSIAGARGQQYTNGVYAAPIVGLKRLPLSTPPFGNCDHNYLDFKNGAALRAFMRPDTVPTPKPKPPVPVPVPTPPPPPPHPRPATGYTVVGKSPNGNNELRLFNNGGLILHHSDDTRVVISKGH
jgi:hypothetical protein